MAKFNEFGIKSVRQSLSGEKIAMSRLLNCEITVVDYKIEDSKYKETRGDKCLWMEIIYKGKKHVVFSGSKGLIEMIEKVPKNKFPFDTTIIEEDDKRLEFT